MSKYSDPLAEVAESILNDGGADAQCGTVEYGGEHYALVTLSYDPMVADTDLFVRFEAWERERAPMLLDGARVIIRTDAQGFVDTFYGPAHPLGDPPAYAALMRAWSEIEADDMGADED